MAITISYKQTYNNLQKKDWLQYQITPKRLEYLKINQPIN